LSDPRNFTVGFIERTFLMENAALRQEVERLRAAEKPEPLKAVPAPEEKEHA